MKLLGYAALAAATLSAQTFSGSQALDEAINLAIEQGKLPGAVLVVGHDGRIVYEKAYGKRALVPAPEPMTEDTIFDIASLTKVVATTSSLMKLFEQGKFRLNDKITDYWITNLRAFAGVIKGIHSGAVKDHLDVDTPPHPLPQWPHRWLQEPK